MRPGCLKYLIRKAENVFFILFGTFTMKNKFPGLNRTYFNKRKKSNFLKHKKNLDRHLIQILKYSYSLENMSEDM